MKLEFDSIEEIKSFLENIGYSVYRYGTVDLAKNPYSPNPFTYPYPPVTYINYDKEVKDPDLSKKIMCKRPEGVEKTITLEPEIPTKTENVLK